jgi:phosphate transport system ATP-binding protein
LDDTIVCARRKGHVSEVDRSGRGPAGSPVPTYPQEISGIVNQALLPPAPHGATRALLPDLAHRHHLCREDGGDGTIKIAIRHLDFWYGAIRALKDVNLDIPDRGITATIGPSGCGKSTLLRTLNRAYDMYADQRATGAISIDGRDILAPDIDLTALRAHVGMTFQKPNPFPVSIFGNIAFGLRLHRDLSRAEMHDRVEKALRSAALWDEVKDILHRPASDLSGGQQQRLRIARAIALDPDILLFDEPCSALDPVSTAQVENLLGTLGRQYCVVIVTHNMQQAGRLSDRVAFMYLGKIVESGISEQIFVNPRDRRTEADITGRFG